MLTASRPSTVVVSTTGLSGTKAAAKCDGVERWSKRWQLYVLNGSPGVFIPPDKVMLNSDWC